MSTPATTEPHRGTTAATPNSADGSAVWLAERALLGALLHNPHRTTELNPWLHAHDFADPAHQAIYTTIGGLHDAGQLHPTNRSTPQDGQRHAITQNVLAVRDALRTQRGTAGVEYIGYDQLVELYQAGSAATTAQYIRYGRMILETSIRRQLHTWAIHLEHAVTAETDHTPLPRAATTRQLAALTTQALQPNELAINPLATSPPPNILDTPPAQLPSKLVERAERHLIHAVIADPHPRHTSLLELLHPEDFVASTAHANTWRAIQTLARRGDPIDPVTVASETEPLTSDPSQRLAARDLATMRTPPHGDTHRAIATVARSALTNHARRARLGIQQAAADRRHTLHDALTTVHAIGTELEQHTTRLARVTQPDQPSSIRQVLDGERPAVPAIPLPVTRRRAP